MKALKIILIAIGVIVLLERILVFLVSNTHVGSIAVAVLAVVLIFYGIFLDKIPQKVHITLWLLCVIPVAFSAFLMLYGRRNNVDYTEDVVIVLGAGLQGDEVGSHLAMRLDTAAEYLNRNANAIVVVSGGLGAGRNITEAEAMWRYLVRNGISSERILQEGKSTSTYENLLFSDEILASHFPDGYRAVVVSNDFHMFRATRQARNHGIDAVALGAPTPWHSIPANCLREMMAVVHFWIFG